MKRLALSFFLIVVFLFVGCSNNPYKTRYVIAGTYLEVTAYNRNAGALVYAEFARLDDIFNIYDEQSELSKLNRTSNEWVPVSDELFCVLSFAKALTRQSDGAFDVTYGRLFELWKNAIKDKRFPDDDEIADVRQYCGSEYFELNRDTRAVRILKKGIEIDLAALAKGYMVQSAVDLLLARGITDTIINAGGDIYCMGKNKGAPWVVGVKNPRVESMIEKINLSDKGVATSGDYEQFFIYKHKRYSHIIDIKTGYPVENQTVSVTVIGKNAMEIDALATLFFALGYDKAKQFKDERNLDIICKYIIVDDDDEKMYTF